MRAETPEEFEELAAEDPIMSTARNALEELSSDPVALRLAQERETAVLIHQHLINSSIRQGKAEAKLEGLQSPVHRVCRILGIAVDAARMAELAVLDEQRLTALLDALAIERAWPKSEVR